MRRFTCLIAFALVAACGGNDNPSSPSALSRVGDGASVNLALSGQTELQLVVTSADDGISFDHADWAMARVTCGARRVDVYLSDMPSTTVNNGWGPIEYDRSNGETEPNDGRPITIDGTMFPKGIGVHALSDVRFTLPSGCSRFNAEIGIDDETRGAGSVIFEVWADGLKLFASPIVLGSDGPPMSGRGELHPLLSGRADGEVFRVGGRTIILSPARAG